MYLKCIISCFFLKKSSFPPLIYNCHLLAMYLATCLGKPKNVHFKLSSTKPVWKSRTPPVHTERSLTHLSATPVYSTGPDLALCPSEMISSWLTIWDFFFWDKAFYNSGWPWTHYVVKMTPNIWYPCFQDRNSRCEPLRSIAQLLNCKCWWEPNLGLHVR